MDKIKSLPWKTFCVYAVIFVAGYLSNSYGLF